MKNKKLSIYHTLDIVEQVKITLNTIKELHGDEVWIEVVEGDKTAVQQFNSCMDTCATDYFLFIDSSVKSISSKFIEKFLEYETGAADTSFGFLGFTYKNEEVYGTCNEFAWAFDTTQRQGYIDLDRLKEMNIYDFSFTIFHIESLKKAGKRKEHFLMAGEYEHLLRYLNGENHLFIVPHFGYSINKSDDENGLKSQYVAAARKEYYFPQDRLLNLKTNAE